MIRQTTGSNPRTISKQVSSPKIQLPEVKPIKATDTMKKKKGKGEASDIPPH